MFLYDRYGIDDDWLVMDMDRIEEREKGIEWGRGGKKGGMCVLPSEVVCCNVVYYTKAAACTHDIIIDTRYLTKIDGGVFVCISAIKQKTQCKC